MSNPNPQNLSSVASESPADSLVWKPDALVIGARQAVVRHLESLSLPLPVGVVRETDWRVLPGVLTAVSDSTWLEVEYAKTLMDDHWLGAPLFIHYAAKRCRFSARSVARTLSDQHFRLDVPFEIRQSPPPFPGGRWVAVEKSGPNAHPYDRLQLDRADSGSTAAMFASLIGADLRLRNKRGFPINRRDKIDAVLIGLALQKQLALTQPGDHDVHAVTMEIARVQPGVTNVPLMLTFHGDRPWNLAVGRSVVVTGLVQGELHTFSTRITDLLDDGMRLRVRQPRTICRYQRRAARRYRLPELHVTAVLENVHTRRKWTAEKLCDLSASGAGVILDKKAEIVEGDAVTLEVFLFKQELKLTASCVSRASLSFGLRLGFQFVGLTSSQTRCIDRLLLRYGKPT